MQVSEINTYPTLTKLVAYLKENFNDQKFAGPVKNYSNGKIEENNLPKYLFRGEAWINPTSLTSRQRILTDSKLSKDDRTILMGISDYADMRLQEKFNTGNKMEGELLSKAYIQHYGLYSELLDFTSNIDICAKFATEPLSLGKRGRICVMDVTKGFLKGHIIDLKAHPFAARPTHQHAYGVYNERYADFQDERCMEEMGLTWFEFEVNDAPQDIVALDIYNINDDRLAACLPLIIDECVRQHGKITDAAAKILAKRVVRLPLFASVDNQDLDKLKNVKPGATAKEMGLSGLQLKPVSLNEISCEVDLEKEEINSIRSWSKENSQPLLAINYKTNAELTLIRILNIGMVDISFKH